jgi:hypothetical protein
MLTNTGDAPAVADLRWVFDGEVRTVRSEPLEPGQVAPATFLTSARLSGGDEHTLRLEVAGAGVRFETRSLTLQGLPGTPKDEE